MNALNGRDEATDANATAQRVIDDSFDVNSE